MIIEDRLAKIESITLAKGAHCSLDQGACIMELVSFIAGERWTDSPQCASPVIAAFLRSYNDSVDDAKRQELKQYIPRVIGTRGDDALEERRSLIVADWLVRTYTPTWLCLAGLNVQADALSSLPEITSFAHIPSIKVPLEAARESSSAAWAAAWAAAWDAARAAARAAAGAAARAAAWDAARAAAGDAAWDAAGTAAWDAAWDAAGAAARAAARAAAWAAAWDAAWDAAGAAAGDAAWDAAWDAARDAARAKLKPTVGALQATIPALIERMLNAK